MEEKQVVEIKDYINVKEKAAELGCNIPTSFTFLPRNFSDARLKEELIHEDTSATIRVLLREKGIVETPLEKEDENYLVAIEQGLQWIGPIIYFTSACLIQNPHLVDISLNVISNYLYDAFKRVGELGRKVQMSIVTETKSGDHKKIIYQGPVSGMKELSKIIRSVHDERRS